VRLFGICRPAESPLRCCLSVVAPGYCAGPSDFASIGRSLPVGDEIPLEFGGITHGH